jgi:hypothetical protein
VELVVLLLNDQLLRKHRRGKTLLSHVLRSSNSSKWKGTQRYRDETGKGYHFCCCQKANSCWYQSLSFNCPSLHPRASRHHPASRSPSTATGALSSRFDRTTSRVPPCRLRCRLRRAEASLTRPAGSADTARRLASSISAAKPRLAPRRGRGGDPWRGSATTPGASTRGSKDRSAASGEGSRRLVFGPRRG